MPEESQYSESVIMMPSEEMQWYCSFNVAKTTPQAAQVLKKIEDSQLRLIRQKQIKKYN